MRNHIPWAIPLLALSLLAWGCSQTGTEDPVGQLKSLGSPVNPDGDMMTGGHGGYHDDGMGGCDPDTMMGGGHGGHHDGDMGDCDPATCTCDDHNQCDGGMMGGDMTCDPDCPGCSDHCGGMDGGGHGNGHDSMMQHH